MPSMFRWAALIAFAWFAYDQVRWMLADLSELRGQRVLVTGTTKGIGKEMSFIFASHGAELCITGRDAKELAKVADTCRELGARAVHPVALDLSSTENYDALVSHVLGAMGASPPPCSSGSWPAPPLHHRFIGGVDWVVLNHIMPYFKKWPLDPVPSAEIAKARKVIEIDLLFFAGSGRGRGEWQGSPGVAGVAQVIEVDLLGYIHIGTALMPELHKSAGRLVIVSSFAGLCPSPFTGPYNAAKHALHGFFESVRMDLDYDGSPASITMAPIGLIATDSAVTYATSTVKFPDWRDPAQTGNAIIKGGLLRMDTMYYPGYIWLTQ
eukprot:gene3211-3732_t